MQGIQILTALPTGKEPTGGTERKKKHIRMFFPKQDRPAWAAHGLFHKILEESR